MIHFLNFELLLFLEPFGFCFDLFLSWLAKLFSLNKLIVWRSFINPWFLSNVRLISTYLSVISWILLNSLLIFLILLWDLDFWCWRKLSNHSGYSSNWWFLFELFVKLISLSSSVCGREVCKSEFDFAKFNRFVMFTFSPSFLNIWWLFQSNVLKIWYLFSWNSLEVCGPILSLIGLKLFVVIQLCKLSVTPVILVSCVIELFLITSLLRDLWWELFVDTPLYSNLWF